MAGDMNSVNGFDRRVRRRIDRSTCRMRGGAFTLLEVLLALSLASTLMVSATFFIFSMGELWGEGSEVRLFERHANAVTRFVRNAMRQSIADPTVDATARVTLRSPPERGMFDDPLISFELLDSPGFLVWPERPLPNIVCYLEIVPGEGLYLLWHSRQEIYFDERAPRRTLLSPFVSGAVYDYYDPETLVWTTEQAIRTGEGGVYEMPARMRLIFEYDGMIKETVLVIPAAETGVALF